MTKSIDEHFIDWEASALGFGYGTGEPHTIPALRRFLDLCREGGHHDAYDHRTLERELGPVVAWLLINLLCREGMIDYGTSSRQGWLTPAGEALRDFMTVRTADELVGLVAGHDDDRIECYRDACHCGPDGFRPRVPCPNPFWGR